MGIAFFKQVLHKLAPPPSFASHVTCSSSLFASNPSEDSSLVDPLELLPEWDETGLGIDGPSSLSLDWVP